MMRPKENKIPGRIKIIWALIILGFMCMEFPGVFFFKDMSEPYIFGFPFIYGWNLIMWAYLVVVIGIGTAMNWGEPKPSQVSKGTEEGGDGQ